MAKFPTTDATPFTSDPWAVEHARTWALVTYFDDVADLFVAWLKVQRPEDQTFIYNNGYPVCRDRFERECKDAIDKLR